MVGGGFGKAIVKYYFDDLDKISTVHRKLILLKRY